MSHQDFFFQENLHIFIKELPFQFIYKFLQEFIRGFLQEFYKRFILGFLQLKFLKCTNFRKFRFFFANLLLYKICCQQYPVFSPSCLWFWNQINNQNKISKCMSIHLAIIIWMVSECSGITFRQTSKIQFRITLYRNLDLFLHCRYFQPRDSFLYFVLGTTAVHTVQCQLHIMKFTHLQKIIIHMITIYPTLLAAPASF